MGCFTTSTSAAPPAAQSIRFSRDILPLLAKRCFACHGPADQESGLALHTYERATARTDTGHVAVVPGRPHDSLLIKRVRSRDPDLRMPHEGPPLAENDIRKLESWIAQGARYEKHWSFVPPRRAKAPDVRDVRRIRTPIDRFVLAKLERHKLTLSPDASAHTQLRRLALDLTGLLPSRSQVSRFGQDPSDRTYRQIVDELLASPHFGERWGRHWLDLARYADSFGYERDDVRPNAWRYRDWVIGSVNDNQPYDQFIIEQVAGDLLPDATLSQRIATGLHRMNIKNNESGINKEDYRNRETVDRVNTTATSVLGLTVGCAQCHNHKYDPISQREFYSFYAFFNNVEEKNIDIPGSDADRDRHKQALDDLNRRAALLKSRRATIGSMRKHAGLATWQSSLGNDPKKIANALSHLRLTTELKTLLAQPAADLDQNRLDRSAAFWKTLPGRHDDAGQAMAQQSVERRHLPKPYVMTIAERSKDRREAHILLRGDFKKKGAAVSAGTFQALPAIQPRGKTADRLDLARWLVSPGNPLSPRVAVNHAWAHLFGRGLAASLDDLGSQGEPPTHPELLDWLATEFVSSGWDRKALVRLIVTSSTYRQSSRHSNIHDRVDPDNELLARQSRFRVESEIIRDLYLDASGLLHREVGGPTIHPVKPSGTEELAYKYKTRWKVSDRPDRYRRGMYILFKRTNPYPSLVIFDSPESTVCQAMRNRSNTPLQALTTLNDPVFFECAQALGRKLHQATGSTRARIQQATARTLSRRLDDDELSILTDLHHDEATWFAAHQADARRVVGLADDDGEPGRTADAATLAATAAWVSVARTILNLDEFINRP